jgi:HlyD family secretion protein
MKRSNYILIAAVTLFLLSTVEFVRSREHEHPSQKAAAGTSAPILEDGLIAAPGRVEAISEELRVSSELSGRLHRVLVEEGDRVRKGQVLAQIENEDYIARVANAQAALAERKADLQRTINGARSQERRAAQEFSLVDADAREEDRRKAEAAVGAAEAQLAEARAYLEKTYIRTPLDGVVLRKLRHTGESVSTQFDSPVVTLADDSTLRVRLDVDEVDVARLWVGQPAFVTAEAYGNQRFTGHIIRVGRILGKKNVRTDEPSERVDTKILETLVQLDPGQRLPLGLRVDAYVEAKRVRN